MRRLRPIDRLFRLVARIVGRGPIRGDAGARRDGDLELQSPEQRLLEVVARHGPVGARETAARQLSRAAAGVRTVAPAESTDEFAPTWVRRMAVPSAMGDEPLTSASPARPRAPRRPRRP